MKEKTSRGIETQTDQNNSLNCALQYIALYGFDLLNQYNFNINLCTAIKSIHHSCSDSPNEI